MNRRDAIRSLALGATAVWWTPTDVWRAAEFASKARSAGRGYEPKFFTPHEWETVRVLVDLIIPRDERSGSATDAGVPEFMDFILVDKPDLQLPMRGGLAWLDAECRQRFEKTFVACALPERAAVLDDLASHGAAFFNSFHDLTASGFWSSKLGVEDLQYQGNTFVPEWKGCPEDALRKLGVRYDD